MLSRRFLGLTTVFLLLSLTSAKEPRAAEVSKAEEPTDPATKVQRLNKQAMQCFDDLDYAGAEKLLLEALALVEKSNLADGAAGLATNGNLAVLYSIGMGDPEKAVVHFKKALLIKPDLKMGKQRSTPETEGNLARAKAEIAAAAPAPGGAGDKGLKCPIGGEIKPGDDIPLKCTTSGGLHPATVMLYYKANGGNQYQVMQMSKASTVGDVTTWVAKIQGADTRAASVPVYFEARDETGGSLATSGREDSPSVIPVKGTEKHATSAAPAVARAEGQEGGEEEGDDEEEEDIDDNNPLARLEKERWKESQGSKGTFWVSLGLGTGLGYAGGKSTEAFGKYSLAPLNQGFAFSGLGQCLVELGYFVGRNTAVSLAYRGQYFLFKGDKGSAIGAIAGLARLLFFTPDEGRLRWYFALAGGGGEGFRFQVKAQVVDKVSSKPTQSVTDTVRGGPFVAGAGGGMLFKLNRHWWWTIDTQALVGFTNYSAVLDFTTGARYQF